MYQAFNDYIIASRVNKETVSATGIITTSSDAPRYLVEKTNDTTKQLQDKEIIALKVNQLDSKYYAIDYKDVVAVVE